MQYAQGPRLSDVEYRRFFKWANELFFRADHTARIGGFGSIASLLSIAGVFLGGLAIWRWRRECGVLFPASETSELTSLGTDK